MSERAKDFDRKLFNKQDAYWKWILINEKCFLSQNFLHYRSRELCNRRHNDSTKVTLLLSFILFTTTYTSLFFLSFLIFCVFFMCSCSYVRAESQLAIITLCWFYAKYSPIVSIFEHISHSRVYILFKFTHEKERYFFRYK